MGFFLFFPKSVCASEIATPSSSAANWVRDNTVTFLGNGASRAQSFLDWVLVNYEWNYTDDTLMGNWRAIRNIVYTMSVLAVIVAGFLIIFKGSQDMTVRLFIKEFVIALLLVTFSFALAHLFFQIADIFQFFFFQTAGTDGGIITGKDIINISFPDNFIGYRRVGAVYNEPAFVSLILIQLSTITFYVIGSILTVRKIILWFFLVSAPLYPILLIYKPIKSTGKIWVQELLRWLLYAPLFALFLSATVLIWKSNILVLPFNFEQSEATYPTAVSILMGGPGQVLSSGNSLNYNDTFTQYVIALLMLWVAILMPFILLQIVLGFLAKYDFGVNYLSNVVNSIRGGSFVSPKKGPPLEPSPVGHRPGGLARKLPIYKTSSEDVSNIKTETFKNVSQKVSNMSQTDSSPVSRSGDFGKYGRQSGSKSASSVFQTSHINTTNVKHDQTSHIGQTGQSGSSYGSATRFANQIMGKLQLKPEVLAKPTTKLINFSIPSMVDIVRFETARLNKVKDIELEKTTESLEKIANPKMSTTPAEEDRFINLQEELNQETAKGDALAESILSATMVVRKPSDSKESVDLTELPTINLPKTNQVQTVSFDDYETVKSLWLENYQQSDIPTQNSNRKEWIENDVQTISRAVTLLSSTDTTKVNEALASISDIVPFFLIGGFSQEEIMAYLKAKLTAAKLALSEIVKKDEEQETLVKNTAVSENKKTFKDLAKEVEVPQNKS